MQASRSTDLSLHSLDRKGLHVDESVEPLRTKDYQLGYLATAKTVVCLTGTILKAIPMTAALFQCVQKPEPMAPDAPELSIVRQPDYKERLKRHTFSPRPKVKPFTLVARHVYPYTQANFLHEAPFRLIMGAAFMGMYQHLGHLRALIEADLIPQDIAGASAGAIVSAMYGCLPLDKVEKALMTLKLSDFFDLSLSTLYHEGALCPGDAFARKLEATFPQGRAARLEHCDPPVCVEVYHQGRTQLLEQGNLVEAVRQSASLPMLFAARGGIDGGWFDQHCSLAQQAGKRSLLLRIDLGGDADVFDRALNRPTPLHNISDDPLHRVLYVSLPKKLTFGNFMRKIDFDKPFLAKIVNDTYSATLEFLASPGGQRA